MVMIVIILERKLVRQLCMLLHGFKKKDFGKRLMF